MWKDGDDDDDDDDSEYIGSWWEEEVYNMPPAHIRAFMFVACDNCLQGLCAVIKTDGKFCSGFSFTAV